MPIALSFIVRGSPPAPPPGRAASACTAHACFPLPPHPCCHGWRPLAVCTTPSLPAVEGGRKAVCTTPTHLALDERLRAVCKLRSDCFNSDLTSVSRPSSFGHGSRCVLVQQMCPTAVGGPLREIESFSVRDNSVSPVNSQVTPNSRAAAVSSVLPAPSAPSPCPPASASASNLAAATGRPPGSPSACASAAPQFSSLISALPPDTCASPCATAAPPTPDTARAVNLSLGTSKRRLFFTPVPKLAKRLKLG